MTDNTTLTIADLPGPSPINEADLEAVAAVQKEAAAENLRQQDR